MVSGFTAAIVVAVLKYRLYDIDVIVNKALVYAALAGFVTALYVGADLHFFLRTRRHQATGADP